MTTQKPKDQKAAAAETHPEHHKVQRRDASGHIDPQYAKELLEKSGKSSNQPDRAFMGTARAADELADDLAEGFVQSATSGEESTTDRHQKDLEADRGGPYVVTSGQEFADGTDASNPEDATREPFPTT